MPQLFHQFGLCADNGIFFISQLGRIYLTQNKQQFQQLYFQIGAFILFRNGIAFSKDMLQRLKGS